MTDAETTRPWPETDVEALLDTPYRIIDLFPRRVPEDRAKAYLRAEAWFLEPPRIKSLRQRQAALLVRLGCYHRLWVNRSGETDCLPEPEPARLAALLTDDFRTGALSVLLPTEHALITIDAGDLYMTVYNASDALLALLRELASAEGLFVWTPE